MALTTGQMLQNRYRIVSMLGQGGMGAVYKAWDTRLNVHLAIKEMIPQPGLEQQTLDQLRQQFQQEAQILARLSHSYLVRVTDFFEESDNAYLVMDFVEGESLSERIAREGALPEAQVLEWSYQLLDALGYCHAQGILHRDIKPQNVIIRSDGRAVLVDFGLVKLWDPTDPHTRTAMRGMGTPEYAPPEQYDMQSGHTDPRSDIYGLGATIYHALTGQAPPTATMRIASPRLFQYPRTLNPILSPTTEAVVLQATALAVEDRFPTTQEMTAALRGEIPAPAPAATSRIQPGVRTTVMPGASVATGVRPVSTTERKRVPVWVWALGGLVILTLVVVTVISQIGPGPTSETARTATVAAMAMDETPTPSPSPSPSPTPTETLTPTSAPTDTPRPTRTPRPTSTPATTPTTSPSPTPTLETPTPTNTARPTSTPASDAMPTPTSSEPSATSPSPTSAPPPPGAAGRIFYTIEAGSIYYLGTSDPSWSQGQVLDPIDYNKSTCAGAATATTLAGQSVNLFYGYRCGIGHPKECPSPNGVYKVVLWETDGIFSMGVHLVSDNSLLQAIYNGPLNWNEPILWAPDSSRFYFTIKNTLHSAAPEAAGYHPVLPVAHQPYLSPDGSMIVYLQPIGTVGAYDVWVANADGSNPRNVTNAPETYKECARWGGF